MKNWGRDIVIAFLAGVVLPAAALQIGALLLSKPGPVAMVPESTCTLPVPQATQPQKHRLYVFFRGDDGLISVMDMDTYLIGAVLAEMPASFEMEALKAQSVAARTYALKARVTGGKHVDGSVCGNSSCCQAYIDPHEYLNRGGTEENVEKIKDAVVSTSGNVLVYEGSLIEATYFSCSGGRTEDAVAVWGAEFPYLISVPSPGEEGAAYYSDTVSYSAGEFSQLIGRELSGAPEEWFGSVTYTSGGGVDYIEIGGEVFRGTQLRTLLGLRSTAFRFQASAGSVTVTTHGYGHRVGMSQYGADAMALRGSTYAEILAHYYPGTELIVWEE